MTLMLRALLAAACLVFSYPPFSIWPLAFMAFLLLLKPCVELDSALYARGSVGRFFYFFFMMFLTYWGGFYWLAHTLHEFGGINWLVAGLATTGIMALFSIFFAFLGWTGLRLQERVEIFRRSRTARIALWVGLMLIWDFADPKAFPWSPVKAVGADRILMASVGLLKTVGWKFLFWIFQGYLLWELADFSWRQGSRRYRLLGVTALLLAFVYGVGLFQIKRLKKSYAETQPVALIQGNVGNYDKKLVKLGVMPTVRNVMNIHRDLIERASTQLSENYPQDKKEPWVIWPETSFPGFPLTDSGQTDDLARWLQLTRGLHMVGAYENAPFQFGDVEELIDYNIVAFFHSKTGYVAHYRKHIRMPFGEYIPGEDLWPQAYKYMPVNHFGRGRDLTLFVHPHPEGPVFIPVICYEVLKEGFLNQFVRKAHEEFPGRDLILLNPSNDSWYGESSEPFHHSLLSRWETARLEIPLLRPTNTGMSQIIAPWGEVLASGPRNQSWVILGDLPVKKAVRDP